MARNEYASYEAGDNQRKAIGNSNTSIIPLPANASLANGHFVAGATGWTAMTSHAIGDTTTQYRFQLGQSGALLKYKSTDNGASWSVVGTIYAAQQNNYYCSVYYTASPATDMSVSGTLIFNTVNVNNGNCYSTSTGMFTCPVTGFYFASFDFFSNNSSNAQRAMINIGGKLHVVNGSYGHSISGMEYCTAGSTIYCGCPNSNYPFTFYTSGNHNRFNVVLVKATA